MKNWICLFVLILLFACQQKSSRSVTSDESHVENGVVKQYDDAKRLAAEITFKNGVRHGVTRIYYSSGELSDEIMYVDDEKSGFAKKFHKNGKLYSLTPYYKDEKNGIQKKFYSNGNIWAETPYMRGQPGIGLKEYRHDGRLRTNFPSIEIQKFVKDEVVVLTLSLSNYSKNVIFYVTDLMEGKYIPFAAKPIYAKGGSARFEIPYTPGMPLDTSLNIVAKYQTQDYNIDVSQRKFQVTIK
ncbi:toxin-antitoxin system YwqK family antitoxin [Labilibaculum antarcticum]|uniref:MORN repeat variant n=1 Tax=Labilibaculum antarcticum TaxID=1717717 RepID=A0A1Y1CHG0_9BACT|nr:hypothetical protein [Labilibaculum antarcticum]BAX79774.1 hypothetical protein ALGA_1390 [Labilibaculum antarcticum]